jgi:phosphoribosyl 1,2-cyclic phosphate phosphodiesterase
VREKAAISLFCGVFFCIFVPVAGKKQKLRRFFAMGMKLIILGSGTSQGVPVIGCRCAVCTSKDPRDNRLRTSAMLEWDDIRLGIDAGPDFRYQMLRTGVRHIDAILLTHEHKDHIGGLDDVRAFNFVDYPTIHRIDVFGTRQTLKCVRKDFDYAFSVDKYRGVPEIELREIDPAVPFCVKDKEVIPVSGHHSPRFEVTGFRFGELAYLTDFKTIAPAEERKLYGVEVLVVNALRPQPHDSHFSLDEALALIRRVAPRRAYLTHMSHEMGLYAERSALLPEGVYLAYDGLEINVND